VKYRRGKCPVCGRRVGIYLSDRQVRIGSHRASPEFEGPRRPGSGCDGAWMPPAPDPELDKARARRDSKRRTLHEQLTTPFREHARIALDAFIDQRPYPALERSILLRVAVHDLNEHHRDHAGVGTAVAVLRYVARRNKSGILMKSGDLYCSFCGELRRRDVKADHYGRMFPSKLIALANTDGHTIECALQHLAFDLAPAAPTVRKLPPEYLEDRAVELAAE